MGLTTVLIADDDDRIRSALSELIDRHEALELVGAVADGSAAQDLARALPARRRGG